MMSPADDCRYLIDGHRPSGSAQKRMACRLCTESRRPCALLQDIDGIRTIVFVPLHANLRRGVKWANKKFWMQEM